MTVVTAGLTTASTLTFEPPASSSPESLQAAEKQHETTHAIVANERPRVEPRLTFERSNMRRSKTQPEGVRHGVRERSGDRSTRRRKVIRVRSSGHRALPARKRSAARRTDRGARVRDFCTSNYGRTEAFGWCHHGLSIAAIGRPAD
jgi:hypothetical protein